MDFEIYRAKLKDGLDMLVFEKLFDTNAPS